MFSFEIMNLFALADFFPNKVTFTGSRSWNMGIFLVYHHSIFRVPLENPVYYGPPLPFGSLFLPLFPLVTLAIVLDSLTFLKHTMHPQIGAFSLASPPG